MAVHVEPLAEVADLVGKADLQRVPRIARVLDHLGDADARADERRVDRLIQGDGAAGVGRVIVADERERRGPEILERGSLAQELRVDRDAESLAVRLAATRARAQESPRRASSPATPCCGRRRRGSPACGEARRRSARTPVSGRSGRGCRSSGSASRRRAATPHCHVSRLLSRSWRAAGHPRRSGPGVPSDPVRRLDSCAC